MLTNVLETLIKKTKKNKNNIFYALKEWTTQIII